jgi:putative membrane protein
MMHWYGGHMSGWGYTLMGFSTVFFWGLLIAGVVALVRHFGRTPADEPRGRPELLLAQRFARGEIDEDEYRRRLEILRSDPRPRIKS